MADEGTAVRGSGVRRLNRSVILELVRTRGPISRAELSRAAGLSLPAVMEIVGRLTGEGLVREIGVGPSTGGRRPVLLELAPQAHRAVGLEVGARTLTAVITDLNAEVKLRASLPSEMGSGPEALRGQIGAVLGEVLGGTEARDLLGIGLSLPAPLYVSTGMVFSPPSYPGWGKMRVGEFVAEEYGLPVLVDNDANAAALGEHLFGAGRGIRDMFYLAAYRGVGGAAILEGELRRGANGVSGEIGHTLVDLDGPRCGCGSWGCLEAFAGRAAIARRAREALRLAGRDGLNGRDGVEQVSTQDVIEAGLEGDEVAREVLRKTGEYLGLGMANAINMFGPEILVVGGSTMKAGELVLGPAEEVARRRALPGLARSVRFAAGELGDDAGPVGAAALVVRNRFARGEAG